MSEADERLARALADAVPPPPHDLDPEALRNANAPERRSGLLAPALTAAATVAAAVTIAALAGTGRSTHPSATHHGPLVRAGSTTTTPPPSGPVTNPQRITARAVVRLLAKVPTFPGAVPVDHAPVRVLRKPMTEWAGNRIHRTRWWLAPGSMPDALAYFTAHPPAGTKPSGSSSAGGPTGTTAEGLSFAPSGPAWERPTVYTGLEIDVAIAPAPGGVAIRVDVQAVWLPQRSAAEHIPSDVTSVDVVVNRNGRPATVRRSLGAADARSVAAIVNRLPVFPPGVFNCPNDQGWTDTLVFRSAGRSVRVVAHAGGCAPVEVAGQKPTLSGGGIVDTALLKLLGLPPRYGP
jgi:hypothetical protein